MAYITKEYLENNIKAYDQYRNLNKEGQANGLATLDANGKLPTSQLPSGIGSVTYGGNEVSSIVQGTNTSMSFNNGALTIAVTNGGGGTIPVATSSTTGGIKVSSGGSKTFDYTWSGSASNPTTTAGTRSATVYKPMGIADGKYYPVECTNDGSAVFCVPNNSPWWDNSGTDPSTKVYVSDITPGTGNFLSSAILHCPSDAIFAELTYYPLNNEGTDLEGNSIIVPKIKSNVDTINFSINESMKVASKNKSGYISLKFATESHTYLITIFFGYSARVSTKYYYNVIC